MMKSFAWAFALASFLAVCGEPCLGGPRASTNYSIAAESYAPAGGARATAGYTVEDVFGEVGTVASSTSYVAKAGFGGQAYRVVGLALNAAPATVEEGQTRQLNAADVLDDTSLLAVDPASVSWSILGGPLTTISSGGVAVAGIVYQHTNATILGARGSFSSTLLLSVLNVNLDDFGIYAADGINDDWQVQYFGENSPNGLAAADPDGDGQNNTFEFTAGLIPNNAMSRFLLRVGAVAGQPNQRQLIFSPRLAGRTYTPEFRTNLAAGGWAPLTGTTQIDNGPERTVIDPNATGASKFYRVQITRP
jgi:hypothetical protein